VHYVNGESDLSLEAAERATQLDPNMVPALRMAGMVLSMKGDYEEAMRYLRAALLNKKESATLREIARAEMRAGNRDVALQWFRRAEKVKPEAETEDAYGYALAQAGRLDDAIGQFNAALSKDPKLADAHYNRGLVRAMRGDVKGAKEDLHQAIDEDADRFDAMTKLAWIVATSPDSSPEEVREAIEFADRAVKRSPDDSESLDTLAAALARGGKFDQAIEVAGRAQYRAARAGNKSMADSVGRRIALYRQDKPYIPGASSHGK
jgi:tetratricopeptide (TPR) repeat protein